MLVEIHQRGPYLTESGTHTRSKGQDLQDALHREHSGEGSVQVHQRGTVALIRLGFIVCLKRRTKRLLWSMVLQSQTTLSAALRLEAVQTAQRLTFIMRMRVLRAIMVMMKYSNGPDTTNCQMRYLRDLESSGMYRHRGRAWIAKSMHCF